MIALQKRLIGLFAPVALLGLLGILASGCAFHGGIPTEVSSLEVPSEARIPSVPFYAQEAQQCGPAALAMALSWSGLETRPGELEEAVYTPKRQGSLQQDLKAACRRYGRLAYEISGLSELLPELSAGHPVIVLQNLGLDWVPKWHYAVAIGYDRDRAELLLHSGRDRELRQSFRVFLNTWDRSGSWGLLVLKPGELPATAERSRYLRAVLGLEQAGELQAAAKGYRAALDRWPGSLTAAIGRGNCLYRLGRLKGAEEAFRQGLEAHPDSPELHNNLAQALLDQGRLKEAQQAAKRAVDLGGEHHEVFEQTLQEIRGQ